MTTLKIISTIALQRPIEQLAADFSAASGVKLELECGATAPLVVRMRDGLRGDVAVLTAEGADDMAAAGILAPAGAPGGTVRLVRSYVGMAVKAGAPHPDISTYEAFMRTLEAAESIVISQAGASGIFMQAFLKRPEVAARVRAQVTILPSGFTATLAADGRAQYAFQQVSELSSVDGIEVVGRLPEGAQTPSVFSAGAFAAAAQPKAAADFVAFMRSPAALPALRRYGLEPL